MPIGTRSPLESRRWAVLSPGAKRVTVLTGHDVKERDADNWLMMKAQAHTFELKACHIPVTAEFYSNHAD
jgi:hypothetical protein